MALTRLIEHLSDPRAYPVPTARVEVHQTHISVVFVTDAYAYKVKKPITLDFLDYSTLDQRRRWCDEEVRLNRRLAPGVYLDVVPIVEHGSTLRVESSGPVVEWAVKMHALPGGGEPVERGRSRRLEPRGRRIARSTNRRFSPPRRAERNDRPVRTIRYRFAKRAGQY